MAMDSANAKTFYFAACFPLLANLLCFPFSLAFLVLVFFFPFLKIGLPGNQTAIAPFFRQDKRITGAKCLFSASSENVLI